MVGRGKLIADVDTEDLLAGASASVVVRSPEAEQLRQALAGPDVTITAVEPGVLQIRGISTEQVGEGARGHGLAIYELRLEQASLEDVFMTMTSDAVEYHAHMLQATPA